MKILVLQLKRIGDLILTTPALLALRHHFPQARITLCIAEPCSALAPALPGVDEVLVFKRRGGNAKLWGKLAVSNFDLCLDFTGNDRSAFFSLLSKASRRITFRWVQRSGFRPLFYNELVNSSVRDNHTVDHYLDLLSVLGIREPEPPPVTLRLDAPTCEAAARLRGEGGLTGPYAVVHPGTARAEKYWLPERWAEVIDFCQGEYGLPCVITGTHQAYERQHLEAIFARMRTPVHDFSGRVDLLGLAALIGGADLLLSMDSSPVHFGAAFGVRQISLFGLTNPFHWRARHPRAVTLLAGYPGPVCEFGSRFPRRPVSDLSTRIVINAIKEC